MENIRLKSCSSILMVLFIGAVLLHHITKGYGSLICLTLALLVMFAQALLQYHLSKDLKMIRALEQNPTFDNLRLILALTQRLLTETQWLTDDSKVALKAIQERILSQLKSLSK